MGAKISKKEFILSQVIPTITSITVRDDLVRYLEADLPITNSLLNICLLYSADNRIKNIISKYIVQ